MAVGYWGTCRKSWENKSQKNAVFFRFGKEVKRFGVAHLCDFVIVSPERPLTNLLSTPWTSLKFAKS